MSESYLTIWVIYDHPADHPDDFVVRPWYTYPGRSEPGPERLYGDLEEARAVLASMGLYQLDRQSDDDPTIVETWF